MRIPGFLLLLLLAAPALGSVSEWMPIEVRNGQPIMPISLNGQPARALLDTGATANFVSQSFLEEHEGGFSVGQGVIVTGVDGRRRTAMANNMRLGMFGTEFEIDQLIPSPFEGFDMIIGLPFFELYVVQIDYPGQRIRIMDHDAINMKKVANVKMRRSGGSAQPQVRVKLNDEVKAWLMLDTGNNGPILYSRSNAERRGWIENYPVMRGELVGINDIPSDMDLFRLPTMTIGPFEMENVLLGIPAGRDPFSVSRVDGDDRSTGWRLKKGGKKKTDGILGFDVLQHFILTIDMKRNRLNLDMPR